MSPQGCFHTCESVEGEFSLKDKEPKNVYFLDSVILTGLPFMSTLAASEEDPWAKSVQRVSVQM